jgi:arylsulfatase A-like enzyme
LNHLALFGSLRVVFTFAIWISAISVAPTNGFAKTTRQPNILFILADDQRWDAIHALGNDQIHTPNLDRLVKTGFHFTNAYCMGSMSPAVCIPSRTMLLTGRSVWRLPDVKGLQAAADLVLLPRVLSRAGYVTYHCGKANNACRYGNGAFDVNVEMDKSGPEDMRHHSDRVISFLEKHDRSRPFFIYLAPPVPHDPRVAPPKFVQMYDANKMTLSRNFMREHPFDNGELVIRDELLAARPRDPDEMRQHLADYYACVSDLDDQVGRIFKSLRLFDFAENTIVIFSSDHGLAVGGRHGLMGKQNLYEHVKPPLIFCGPGIAHGRSESLVYLYDLFPTICELAGASTPKVVEGQSLVQIVRGKTVKTRPYLFTAYRDCQRMVRDDRWKLIEYFVRDERHTQLFDLSVDSDELINRSDDKECAKVLGRLRSQLKQQGAAFGDPDVALYAVKTEKTPAKSTRQAN